MKLTEMDLRVRLQRLYVQLTKAKVRIATLEAENVRLRAFKEEALRK